MDEPHTHRDALIARIGDVFRSHGFAGATLAELSKATGLKRASLYHHFPGGKAEMAVEVLDAAVTELDRLAFRELAGATAAPARLAAFIAGFGRYCHGGTRACAIVSLAMGADADTQARIRAELTRWTDTLASFFSLGRSVADARLLAGNLLSDLNGALITALLRHETNDFGARLNAIASRYVTALDHRQSA